MRVRIKSWTKAPFTAGFYKVPTGKALDVHFQDLFVDQYDFKKWKNYVLMTDLEGRLLHIGLLVPEEDKINAIEFNAIIASHARAGKFMELHMPEIKDEKGDPKYSVREKFSVFYVHGTGFIPGPKSDPKDTPPLPEPHEVVSNREDFPEIPHEDYELRAEVAKAERERKANMEPSVTPEVAEKSADLKDLEDDEEIENIDEVIDPALIGKVEEEKAPEESVELDREEDKTPAPKKKKSKKKRK